jgi:hypothetical protein
MANREKKEVPPTPPHSEIFITEVDERRTTIKSLFAVLRQAVHPKSGELLDEEREAISWMLYFAENLVEDDRVMA